CQRGVRVLVVGKLDQRNGQGPAATAGPRRVVYLEGGAEDVSDVAGEEIPGDGQVTGRIADPHTRPVNDGAEPPIGNEDVPGREVGVEPDRRTVPLGNLKGGIPRGTPRLEVC